MTAENARKKSDLVKICGHFLDKYDCNDRRQCCFSKYITIIKVFIICQHLIAYLSHINILCPIIANSYIPGSHTNLLCQFDCYAFGCLVVCCKQVGEQMVIFLQTYVTCTASYRTSKLVIHFHCPIYNTLTVSLLHTLM